MNSSEIVSVNIYRKTFCCHHRGFSMVEAIVAMLVMSIIILGTVGVQYRSSLDSQRAEVNANASRIALLLTEAWRGSGGNDTFDPVAEFGSDLTLQMGQGPLMPSGFILLGKYEVELESINYFVTLSYQDINSNLRSLNATVTWKQEGVTGTAFANSNKSFSLVVYADK